MKRLFKITMVAFFACVGLANASLIVKAQEIEAKDMEKGVIAGSIELGDEDTVVSDVMTYEEVLQDYANDNGVDIEQAKQCIRNNDMRKASIKMKTYNTVSAQRAMATYRTVTVTFKVTETYRPQLKFYCRTSESSTMWGIYEILNVSMNRASMGKTKQFSGTVYTNLENSGKIYWEVNGDFYNEGTTTVGGGGSVKAGIGETASVSFSISGSYESSFYAYCFQSGHYII